MNLLPASIVLALAAVASAPAAFALDLQPDTAAVQFGPGKHGTFAVTAGLGWDASWQRQWGPVLATAHAELFAGVWRADDFGGGHQHFAHLGILPTLRLRFDEGRSPWFFDAGIGLSWTSPRYVTPHKTMGSNFNFTDMLGVGRSFGPGGRHELSVRYNHVSNAGLRKPNPGEDFLLLRLATRF